MLMYKTQRKKECNPCLLTVNIVTHNAHRKFLPTQKNTASKNFRFLLTV